MVDWKLTLLDTEMQVEQVERSRTYYIKLAHDLDYSFFREVYLLMKGNVQIAFENLSIQTKKSTVSYTL